MSMGDDNATHLKARRGGELSRGRGREKKKREEGRQPEREREREERGERERALGRLAWLCLLHWQAKGGRQARQPGSP